MASQAPPVFVMVPGGATPCNDHAPQPERIMNTSNTPPARAGRERTCTQCGAIYRSPRNTSRFCSASCRKKAHRGTPPTGGPKAGPENFSIIGKALYLAGYVGRIGPTFDRDKSPPVYALLVPFEHALDELSFQFNRKGWGYVSREEFTEALKRDGIKGFISRSPAALEEKRNDDRNRQWRARAA